MDIANGYYHIKMEGEELDKTTFITRYGQFVFNQMILGLANAPGTFCRALGLILRSLSWKSVIPFLGNIIFLGDRGLRIT